MELPPFWIWPLFVCLLALAARFWLGTHGGHRGKGNAGRRVGSRAIPPAVPSTLLSSVLPYLANPFMRAVKAQPEAIDVIGRKVIGPQHTVVLLGVWDQEIALSVQPGVPPTLIATRTKQPAVACGEPPVSFHKEFSRAGRATVAEEWPCN